MGGGNGGNGGGGMYVYGGMNNEMNKSKLSPGDFTFKRNQLS